MADSLGLGPGLTGSIGTHLVDNTYFFVLDVTWSSPDDAARIANKAVQIFIEQNRHQQQASAASATGNTDLNKTLTYYRAQIAGLQRQIASVGADTKLDPGARDQRANSLQSTLGTVQDTYFKLLSLSLNGTSNGGQLSTATVVDAAAAGVPLKPSAKRSAVYGAISGLLISLGLIFLLDYLDQSIRTPEELERLAGQSPIGIIGLIRGQDVEGERKDKEKPRRGGTQTLPPEATRGLVGPAANGNGAARPDAGSLGGPIPTTSTPQLVTLRMPRAPISEAFRALRTNLEFSSLDVPLKSMVITSMLPGEGKSTLVSNLAVVLAQAGKRVILVDTDLRRPTLHRIFGLRNTTGFTSALLNAGSTDQAVGGALRASGVPNLLLLTSGPLPHNPSELLSSERVTQLIAALEARADIVLFDTPPMAPLTDAVLLSTKVTGTLVVVRARTTRRPVIQNGLRTLNKVGARTLGVVLNMVNQNDVGTYSYYYYYSSGYYAQEPEPAHALPLS